MKDKILALLAFCAIMIVLSSPALASGTAIESIEINPVLPEVWMDLTCNALVTDDDGDLNIVRFTWLRNGVGIRTFEREVSGFSASVSDRLDKDFTEERDQIKCRVEVWDTSTVEAGDYVLQLVVVDNSVEAELQCRIPVRISTTLE